MGEIIVIVLYIALLIFCIGLFLFLLGELFLLNSLLLAFGFFFTHERYLFLYIHTKL